MPRRNRINPATDSPTVRRPALVLLSNDERLVTTVRAAAADWTVLKCEIANLTSLIREPDVGLVIFDDQSVASADRGWVLTEIRRCASRASIIYVTGDHDHASERLARARGVLFYTAKPLDPGYLDLLLQRLLQMHNGNNRLANR